MIKIEDLLNWPTSETGIKYRMTNYKGITIRGLVKTEEECYRVIFDAYKNGKSIETAANSFENVLDAETVFINIKSVYDKLTIEKPKFEKFLAMTL